MAILFDHTLTRACTCKACHRVWWEKKIRLSISNSFVEKTTKVTVFWKGHRVIKLFLAKKTGLWLSCLTNQFLVGKSLNICPLCPLKKLVTLDSQNSADITRNSQDLWLLKSKNMTVLLPTMLEFDIKLLLDLIWTWKSLVDLLFGKS